MPRFTPLTTADAEGPARELLTQVEQAFGKVPNILGTMARSPAVLRAYLQLAGALKDGALGARLGEQLALFLAGRNHCAYCAAAHTMKGKGAGLSAEEAAAALRGQPADPQGRAVVTFAAAILDTCGKVSDQDVQAARDAGLSDEQILEIVPAVALNLFTNYFNHVVDTDVDFPAVDLPD